MLSVVTLLITALAGIAFGVLATQNTTLVDIRLASYSFPQVPVYVVALGSLLIGVLLAASVHLIQSLSSFFVIQSKNSQLKHTEGTIKELEDKIRGLELENAGLKEETGEDYSNTLMAGEHPQPNLWDRLRQNLSF